ncbi:MAG: Fic family protein [Candidatus Micrarchaeota archaeon]|nr:Fic family protein [Candidatus Micrarchaeota archaeon]MDE1848142.1 Fic family protein [Candidatus Micrarchaeota archaeon]MDE1864102.1 Fic family protein [Candidatus Micrarchaeota archaeon]
MVKIAKKVISGKTYYYLGHSFRSKGKVSKKEVYLGPSLPKNINQIKKAFVLSIYKKKWYDSFDKIKKNAIKQFRSMPIEAREKALDNFIVKFTYDTNRIEGSKLTYHETAELLERGITPSNRPIRDVKESEAHNTIFRKALKEKKRLSFQLILYWHRELFKETKSGIAGDIRKHQVEISGSKFLPPSPVEVYPLMVEFFKWYNKNEDKLHPVELAALVHLKLVTIHPFVDGNGRISRLVMNLVLHRHEFPMLNIQYTGRKSYYNALERSQVKKEESVFLQWFFKRYLSEYKKYL